MIRSTINNEQWYKSMLVGNAPFLPSDYELIETVILGSSQASITFSSLGTYSSTYKHLQVRLVAVDTFTGGNGSSFGVTLNGDTTGGNYSFHNLVGNGLSIPSGGAGGSGGSVHMGANGRWSASVIDILDAYSTSKNKTMRIFGGNLDIVELFSIARYNTASITSINIATQGFGLAIGSRFSLYGIKG
jgi:hypothetical protein